MRNNIQGKRVNYAARTVISPDIALNTSEVGIPDVFAKCLTFPETTNEYNVKLLQELVKNGNIYPGADRVEMNGKTVNLSQVPREQRDVIAEQLLGSQAVVYRHVLP